jgi:hypothetical protein
MSKRVDKKVQNKVKSLESEPVAVHFPPALVSLVKEWHQMMVIPNIRKVSMIWTSFPLISLQEAQKLSSAKGRRKLAQSRQKLVFFIGVGSTKDGGSASFDNQYQRMNIKRLRNLYLAVLLHSQINLRRT